MDNEQRGAEALAYEPARLILAALGLAEQIAIGMHHIGVGGDRVEALHPSALRFDLAGMCAHCVNADDGVAQPHGAAQPLEMTDHACHQPARSATRPPCPADRKSTRLNSSH